MTPHSLINAADLQSVFPWSAAPDDDTKGEEGEDLSRNASKQVWHPVLANLVDFQTHKRAQKSPMS